MAAEKQKGLEAHSANEQEESETPVPTTVLDLQKRNSVEICNGDQEMLAAIIDAHSSSMLMTCFKPRSRNMEWKHV